MTKVILFNKPFQVLCQFSPHENKDTLKNYIDQPNFYPCGRLDYDSEGLLILSNDGNLQTLIAHPKHKMQKTYWVQVEGEITQDALEQLRQGITLKDGVTKPARAKRIQEPQKLWERTPPIRERKNIPTCWIELTISEGKNRQVRRMTAAVGFPTLRLIRAQIGDWGLSSLLPGGWCYGEIPENLTDKLSRQSIAKSKTRSKKVAAKRRQVASAPQKKNNKISTTATKKRPSKTQSKKTSTSGRGHRYQKP